MKYILVLLISFAFGQGTIVTDTDSKCGTIIDGIFYEEECLEPELITTSWGLANSNTDVIKRILESSIILANTVNVLAKNQSKFISINDINKYAEECYNDSFQIDVYNECEMYGIGCLVDHGTHKEWNRPTPTFPGFIEWYERRIK